MLELADLNGAPRLMRPSVYSKWWQEGALMLLILAVAGAFVILPGGGRPGLDLLRIDFSIWHFQAPFFVSRRCGRDLRSPT
ncbi:MAG: hypothetical protein ABGY96_08820, partial [bacterium]